MNSCSRLLAGAFCLILSHGTAQLSLVKDITPPGGGTKNSAFGPIVNFNGIMIFLAYDEAHSYELWKSDGTPAGTGILKDINPGTSYSIGISPPNSFWDVYELTVTSSAVYFIADNGELGTELWRTDGTTGGTVLVKDINPGSASSIPYGFTELNGKVYFAADDGVHGIELWQTDGTEAGTVMVKDIAPGATASMDTYFRLTAINGKLFFIANDGVHGGELWSSDGSEAGTAMVKNIDGTANSSLTANSVPNFFSANGILYFTANDGVHDFELWASDGTEPGTAMVKDINPAGPSSAGFGTILLFNNKIYFWVYVDTGFDLWVTDGSEAGTQFFKDFNPDVAHSYFPLARVVNGRMYFSFGIFNNSILDQELWTSDGTDLGTIFLKSIRADLSQTKQTDWADLNGELYFKVYLNDATELWKTDGTPQGTLLVRSFHSIDYLSIANSSLFLSADDGIHGLELWKSDGSTTGTQLFIDINDSPSQYPTQLASVNNTIYFVDDNGTTGKELWKSDGTAAGTVLVKDINPGTAGSDGSSLSAINGSLFFFADDGVHGQELWKSDGSPAGTVLVKDINPGAAGSPQVYWPGKFVEMNSIAYFLADDGTHGYELWSSDGTESGTHLLKDLNSASGYYYDFVRVGNTLYIASFDEIWKSDGTTNGTVLVLDIAPSGNGIIYGLCAFNNQVYFQGNDGTNGSELWRSDGTPSGTAMVTSNGNVSIPLAATSDWLYFIASNGVDGNELWKTDGTQSGTSQVKDINPNGDTYFSQALVANDVLYLYLDDGVHGWEFWRSDGTAPGTFLVKDINPGRRASSFDPAMVLNNNSVYFSADDLTHGAELWKSDGTSEGTRLVKDIYPGESPSFPKSLVVANNRIFFTARDESHGTELWMLNPFQSISFNALPDKTAIDDPFTIAATASSGLTVSFAIVTGPASISGNTLTITGAGDVTVRAAQPGDAIYDPAEPVIRTLTVSKASQTITFTSLSDKNNNDPPFLVSATTTSGLPVTFSVASGPATVVGSTVTLSGAGLVDIRASQAGNDQYLAAANMDQSFTVKLVLGLSPEEILTIEVYPNPATDRLTIRVSEKADRPSLRIVSLLGDTVWKQDGAGHSTSLPLDGLSKGIYFVQFDCPTGHATQKLVVE